MKSQYCPTRQHVTCQTTVIFINYKIFSVHLKLGTNQLHAQNYLQTHTLL